jgi:type I restriction enzyme S subunit
MSALPFLLPPYCEQVAIAEILGTLDDKIELNRRMNETLEAMARAIFKSWFIDFDPVRAKAGGRQPFGMDAETAALFPNSSQDSPLGRIPKGWKAGAIGDFVTAVGGSTPSTKKAKFWDGSIHFATPKDMSSLQSPILIERERRITEAGSEHISSGLLPKGTVLLSSRAPIGYLALTEIPVAVNQRIIAMICEKELPSLYVLHWVKENMETIVANANGTPFLEISKASFRPILTLVPPSPVLEGFTKAIEPLHRSMVSSARGSKTLAAIRDALLPKLISGEVRVVRPEKLAEARPGKPRRRSQA